MIADGTEKQQDSFKDNGSASDMLMDRRLVMSKDEQAHADDLRVQLVRRWPATDVLELEEIDALVTVMIKARRLDVLEFEAMERAFEASAAGKSEEELAAEFCLPTLATLTRYRSSLGRDRQLTEARLHTLVAQSARTKQVPDPAHLRNLADFLESHAADNDNCKDEPEPEEADTPPASAAPENAPQEFEEAVPPQESSSAAPSSPPTDTNEPTVTRQQRRYLERQARKAEERAAKAAELAERKATLEAKKAERAAQKEASRVA